MSGLARIKRGVRGAVALNGGVDGAAATAGRSRSVAGDWNGLNSGVFPSIDCALALDEVAVAQGKLPPIAVAYARELGGLFVPHIDVAADEGTAPALVMQLAVRLGDVAAVTGRAMANDGRVDAKEAEQILHDLDEHDRVSRQYRALLSAIRENGQ